MLPPTGRWGEPRSIVLAVRPDAEPWFLLEHAVDWTRALGGRLSLCSVRPSADASVAGYSVLPGLQLRRERRAVIRRLSRLMDAVPPGLRGGLEVLDGDPATELRRIGDSHSLLIVGRSARRGFASLLKPSVPDSLAREGSTPVMIVAGRRPRSSLVALVPITAACDGLDAVEWVVRHLPGNQLVAVRVQDSTLRTGRIDVPPMLDCQLHTVRRGPGFTAFGAGRVLANCAGRFDADIVVVPAVGATGVLGRLWGSLTDGLVRESPCTLLVVPKSRERSPGRIRQLRVEVAS